VEISTTSSNRCADAATCKDDGILTSSSRKQVLVNLKRIEGNAIYTDVSVTISSEDDCDAPAIICPPPPYGPSQGCYIHIEDQMRLQLQGQASMALQGFICDGAKTLHVHDSLNITSILSKPPASVTWNQLEWCGVEQCPKLACVFSPQLNEEMFNKLRTAWASHLPYASCIWKWSDDVPFPVVGKMSATFADVTTLHPLLP
jgi:hypothetical protein